MQLRQLDEVLMENRDKQVKISLDNLKRSAIPKAGIVSSR